MDRDDHQPQVMGIGSGQFGIGSGQFGIGSGEFLIRMVHLGLGSKHGTKKIGWRVKGAWQKRIGSQGCMAKTDREVQGCITNRSRGSNHVAKTCAAGKHAEGAHTHTHTHQSGGPLHLQYLVRTKFEHCPKNRKAGKLVIELRTPCGTLCGD